MPQSRENENTKQRASKGVKKTFISRVQQSLRPLITKEPTLSALQGEPESVSIGTVLTQEEYRARIARKAFELYEKRQALTDVDDWMEAERLVKLELLEEQRGATA
jgi:hypothetical protein